MTLRIPEPIPPVEKLQEVYRAGSLRLTKNIHTIRAAGKNDALARAALTQALSELERLRGYTDTWIEQNIPTAYRSGWDDAFKSTAYVTPKKAGFMVDYQNFAKINKGAIEQVAYAMQGYTDAALYQVGRQIEDIYRKKGLEAVASRLITGETVKETQKRLARELLERTGSPYFIDKAGKRWKLDNYASMVARTTTREATTAGTLNRAELGGYQLVQISEHDPTCEICAPFGGLVFTLDSKDKRYPVYNDYIPLHPNCLHVVYIYISKYDPNELVTMRRSQAFDPDVDPRSDAQKAAYDAIQGRNAELNALRNQHARYVHRLGDDAGTIQSFAASKRADSDRWQNLQQMYREAGR